MTKPELSKRCGGKPGEPYGIPVDKLKSRLCTGCRDCNPQAPSKPEPSGAVNDNIETLYESLLDRHVAWDVLGLLEANEISRSKAREALIAVANSEDPKLPCAPELVTNSQSGGSEANEAEKLAERILGWVSDGCGPTAYSTEQLLAMITKAIDYSLRKAAEPTSILISEACFQAKRANKAEAEVKQVREALLAYGEHFSGCVSYRSALDGCDCGYRDALGGQYE